MIERYHIKHINSEVERLLGAPQVALKGDQYILIEIDKEKFRITDYAHELGGDLMAPEEVMVLVPMHLRNITARPA